MRGKKLKISVVVITKNEQNNIKGCLESVRRLADEIILVDDFSYDSTVDIAKKYTKKIFQHKLETLGKQKQWASKKAKGEWILLLDADERINSKLTTEIKSVLRNPQYDAYNIYFQQFFLGKPLPPTLSGGHPRLFRREKGKITADSVHERIIIEGKMGQLKNLIFHYSFRSISQTLAKFNKYTNDEAEIMYQQGVRVNLVKIIFCLPYHFWIRQKVYKDYKAGTLGFIMTMLFVIYHFLKWAKIWELQYREKEE